MDKFYFLTENKLTVVLVLVIILLSVALIIVNNRGISLHPIQALRAALDPDIENYFRNHFIDYKGYLKTADLEMSNFFNEKIFKDFKVKIEDKVYNVGVIERQGENILMVMLTEVDNPINIIEITRLDRNILAELRFDNLLFQTKCDIIGYLYEKNNPSTDVYTLYSKEVDKDTIYVTERNNIENIYDTYRTENRGEYIEIILLQNGGNGND